MKRAELVAWLDSYLAIGEYTDSPGAHNGLQVEGAEEITCVATAVDACLYTIEQAVAGGAQMLFVHHGLFWNNPAPFVGPAWRRVRALVNGSLAVYGCHIPLDAHPEVGNNAGLIRALGLEPEAGFLVEHGKPIGWTARCDLRRDEIVARVAAAVGDAPYLIPAGPERIERIGVCTGGAGSYIRAAHAAGVDLFLTGEGAHYTYFDAEENGVNVVYAGHYATETFGVKAVGGLLHERFGARTFFIDHPTGL